MKNDFISYKKRIKILWDELAPRYHKRWASTNNGPFQSSAHLVKLAKIKNKYSVLDVACGTGSVTKKIVSKIGKEGLVVGVDSSYTAIALAKKNMPNKDNIHFVLMDAENITINKMFDVITCQYALFYFPNAQKALKNMKKHLKSRGVIVLSVHGSNIPFFDSITDIVTKFISDYTIPGSPDLARFSTKKALRDQVVKAGFSNIKITPFTFRYSPGTFNDYWGNYLKYIAKSLKEKFDKLSLKQKRELRKQVKEKTIPYTKNEKITFPWEVLILTARKL